MEQIHFPESMKAKLAEAETVEEIAKICEEEGIGVTKEQLQAAMEMQSDELREEDLEQVAGGYSVIILAIAVMAFWYLIQQEQKRRVKEKLRKKSEK